MNRYLRNIRNGLLATLTGIVLGVFTGLLVPGVNTILVSAIAGLAALMGYGFSFAGASRRVRKESGKQSPGSHQAHSHVVPFQINSIFLFNTLHNILALAQIDQDRAIPVIEQLADYIRAVAELNQNGFNLVSQEFRCIELYLRLEKNRLGDRFTFERRLAPYCLEMRIPNLLLLSLIEKTVQHGIELSEEESHLSMSVDCPDQAIEIVISHSGGKEIREAWTRDEKETAPISALESRLTRIYSSDARIELETTQPEATSVRIYIPIKDYSHDDIVERIDTKNRTGPAREFRT